MLPRRLQQLFYLQHPLHLSLANDPQAYYRERVRAMARPDKFASAGDEAGLRRNWYRIQNRVSRSFIRARSTRVHYVVPVIHTSGERP